LGSVHIVPVSRGGSNAVRNVELLWEACNRSRGNWIQQAEEAQRMTITLNLAPDMEAYLREWAARKGQAAEDVAQALIAEAMERDTANGGGVSLAEHGISPAQAAELRARFATFAEEWERPEMDVYDDYDAAKARLEAKA